MWSHLLYPLYRSLHRPSWSQHQATCPRVQGVLQGDEALPVSLGRGLQKATETMVHTVQQIGFLATVLLP